MRRASPVQVRPRSARPPRREDGRRAARGPAWAPWAFLAPYLVLFVGFVLAPAVYGLWISLHDYDYTLPGKPWVGLDNYAKLFSSDSVIFSDFWDSMRATAIFTVFSVPLLLVLPLGVALLMNRRFRGPQLLPRASTSHRTSSAWPSSRCCGASCWTATSGWSTSTSARMGLPDDTAWLTTTPAAWVALVGVTVWWTMGFNAVIYLAGLQDIPPELYEAARVDGANAWQQFWHVTLPGLRAGPVVRHDDDDHRLGQHVRAVLPHDQGCAGCRRPAPRSTTITDKGLSNFQMGDAAAMSYVLTLALILLSVAVFWLFRERKA